MVLVRMGPLTYFVFPVRYSSLKLQLDVWALGLEKRKLYDEIKNQIHSSLVKASAGARITREHNFKTYL